MYSTNWLPILRIGFRVPPQSWKIMDIRVPLNCLHSSLVLVSRDFPLKRISPCVTLPPPASAPRTALITVVFPLPLSPTTLMISPFFIFRLKCSIVGACFPYRTERSFISSINNAPSYLLLCFLDYICVHLF